MNSANEFFSRLFLPIIAVVLLASLSPACTPEAGENEQALKLGEYTPSNRLWTENQGIGPDWYQFVHGRGADVVPYGLVYAIEGESGDVSYVQFTSYYDGGWGHVALNVANGAGSSVFLSSPKSLYDEPVCIHLNPAKYVPCNGDEVDLLFLGTDRAALDHNSLLIHPTIYTVPKDGRKVYAIQASSIANVDRVNKSWKKGLLPLLDAYVNHAESRIARAVEGHVELSVNPERMVSAWQMRREGDRITAIDTLCTPFSADPYMLKNGVRGSIDLTKLTFEPQGEGDNETSEVAYGVKLCSGKVERIEGGVEPWVRVKNGGLIPLDYDLILFRSPDGKLQPILGPETISWSAGLSQNIPTLDDARNLKITDALIEYSVIL